MITLAFQIPPIEGNRMTAYIDSLGLSDRWTDDSRHVLRTGLEPNPRRYKRFVNGIELLFDVLDASKPEIDDPLQRARFVKMSCIAYRWSAFFFAVARRPQALLDYVQATDGSHDQAVEAFKKAWPQLASVAASRDLYEFVKESPSLMNLSADEVQQIVALIAR